MAIGLCYHRFHRIGLDAYRPAPIPSLDKRNIA
jgi:hypothetical protein